jgi:hypothetical protein
VLRFVGEDRQDKNTKIRMVKSNEATNGEGSEGSQHGTIPGILEGFWATLLHEPRNSGGMFHPRVGTCRPRKQLCTTHSSAWVYKVQMWWTNLKETQDHGGR